MGSTIERTIASITEDRRTDYLWDTKQAAKCLNIHPNKFEDWWGRTEAKLLQLMADMPGETSAMLAVVVARGITREKSDL